MKKLISILLSLNMLLMTGFAFAEEISVISREDGSGTRGAFIELFGIEQKNADGVKLDYTTDDCDITNATSVMMTSVAGNDCAIGYIAVVEEAPAFEGGKVSGKIVIAGSSSATPVMEKLAEAYESLNPDVEIELQQSDSSSGMTSTRDGVCDIGMASRALKDSEIEAGLNGLTIAMDGIAVIVSPDNPVDGLTTEQVRDIYMGEITEWSEVNE